MRPSIRIFYDCNSIITAFNTFSVTLTEVFKPWLPSLRTSGSIIGTIPLYWQILANLVIELTILLIAYYDGMTSETLKNVLNLANLHPES
jgi:hypothetical protein